MSIVVKNNLIHALNKFSESFCKVYEVNLSDDTYSVILLSDEEFIPPGNSISKAFADFIARHCVFEDDVERFRSLTNLAFLKDYFLDNDAMQLRYRRLQHNIYHWTILKMVRHPEYTDDNQKVYLYVYDSNAEPLSASRYKNDQIKILHSLAEIYVSMHLIDLKRNAVTMYGTKDHIEVFRTSGGDKMSITEQMSNVIKNVVVPEFLESALKFTDLSTLAERMGNKKVITSEFIGKFKGKSSVCCR